MNGGNVVGGINAFPQRKIHKKEDHIGDDSNNNIGLVGEDIFDGKLIIAKILPHVFIIP